MITRGVGAVAPGPEPWRPPDAPATLPGPLADLFADWLGLAKGVLISVAVLSFIAYLTMFVVGRAGRSNLAADGGMGMMRVLLGVGIGSVAVSVVLAGWGG